jgi:hypothetical protein
MIDTLIVVKSNHYGLTRDSALLASALADAGVKTETAGIHDRPLLDRLQGRRQARRIIHIERVFPQWVGAAEVNVLVPNQERFPPRQLGRLRKVDLVLAKTHEAVDAFAGRGVPVEYLGFTSEDRFDARFPKDWNRVLHLAGGSTLKGTEDVLALWERHPEWPQLVLVQKRRNAPRSVPRNVRLIAGYIDDGELRRLQNECGIHLCPSRSEGWGHNLVEGLSCGALVITTDAPPMNEHVNAACGVLVAASRAQPRHMGTSHFVSSKSLEDAIQAVIDMPLRQKAGMGDVARKRFQEIGRGFPARVAQLLAGSSLRDIDGSSETYGAAGAEAAVKFTPGVWFNRPGRRYLVRLYRLLRYGWANAHAEEWWPDLVLSLPSGGDGAIRYRGKVIAPLLPYPASSGMDEIVIVGTGPSLATQAMERIPIESALLLNGAIHLIGPGASRPLGVVIEDERFVWRHWRTIVAKVPAGTHCYLSTSVIRALCETAPEWLAQQTVHHLDFLHRPYGARRPDAAKLRGLPFLRWSGDGKTAISLVPQTGLMPAGTVAVSAAQLALSFAPSRIGLAGIDLTNTGQPRFYEVPGDQAMSRVGVAKGRILATFEIIRDECARRGIAIENYSPVSRLAELGVPYVPRLEL